MNIKNFSFFVIFLAGLFAFAIIPFDTVLAQEEVGGIEIKDVKITPKDDKLEVSAVLFNPSQNIETPPFTHLLTLSSINQLFKFGESIVTPPSILVSAVEGSDYVSLKPREQRTVNFSLPIGHYLPKNNYTLNIKMILTGGEALDYHQDVIYELGSNQKVGDSYKSGFLSFDQQSCVMINTDGREFGNNDGPIFKPMETPKIRCAVKNVGQEEIMVFPNIEWKEFFVYGRPASGKKAVEKLDKAITFKSGEIKTIELSLPAVERPQVYQALLSFIDKDNVVRSYNMAFRWTIGGSSARVERVALASPIKSVYEKGETISLSVDYFGSMDLFWAAISQEKVSALAKVKISAVIKDKKERICGQTETPLPDVNDANIHNRVINIKLDKQCSGVSYDVSLFSDDNKLAGASDVFPAVIEEGAEGEKSGIPFVYYIIGALIIIFAYKIFTIMNRRRHKDDWQKTLLLFLFIAGSVGFFLGGFNTAEAVKTLTVQNIPNGGTGTVTNSGGINGDGINCGADCIGNYRNDVDVTLIATPAPGSAVYGWSVIGGGGGRCPRPTNINRCLITMGDDKTVTVEFRRAYTLTIGAGTLPADGSGTITGSGINCIISNGTARSGDCSESYAFGTPVSVGISPLSVDDIFAGWANCAGGSSCFSFSMDGDKTLNALFYKINTLKGILPTKTKTYNSPTNNSFTSFTNALFGDRSATGVGDWINFSVKQVTADLSSNNKTEVVFTYAGSCSNLSYLHTRVQMAVGTDILPEQRVDFKLEGLLVPYDPNYVFDVTIGIVGESNRIKSFEIDPLDLAFLTGPNPYLTLYITAATKPFGPAITYYRRGIFNSSVEPYTFDVGSTIPPPSTAAAFAVSDVIKIKIPLNIPPPSRTLDVTSSNGTVTGPDGTDADSNGINCKNGAGECSDTYNDGTNVALTAVPDANISVFSSWSGDCSGITNPCNLAMSANRNITANFNLIPTADIDANGSDGPVTIPYNTSATLSWTSTNATSCSIPEVPLGGTSGSQSTGNLTSGKTYTLSCSGPGGSDSDSVTIAINTAPGINSVGLSDALTVNNLHPHSGASATDADGDSMTYTWSWISCPGVLPCPTLANNLGSVIGGSIDGPTYTPDEAGNYILKLTVTDSMGATGEATLTETTGSLTPSNWWDLFRTLWKEKK